MVAMTTWDDKPNDYDHALKIIAQLEAEIARLKELKTPVSRQLLNVTKAAWDHAEEVNDQLRAEVDEKQQMIAALRDVLALSEAILKFHLIGTASAPASSTP
jgi:hypothetical protein